MSDYFERTTGNTVIDSCDENQHPTDVVYDCSPDPVLTHDGRTSQACRHCACGKHTAHVTGCTSGLGPPRTDCEECANDTAKGQTHELWCSLGPKTMTMGELREMLIKAIEIDDVSETKSVGLLATRKHWNSKVDEDYLKPLRFLGVQFVRGQFVFVLAETPLVPED